MADKKISQLTALSAANLAPSTDVLAIVDTSATETKKIVAQDLINGVLNVASAVGIGTASPSYKLHVVGGAAIANRTTSDTPGNISLGVLSTSSVATFGWRTDSSNNLHFDIYNGASWSAALTTSLAGNLGLGVTPSAWGSPYLSSFQMKSGGILANNQADDVHFGVNCFHNGTNWRYIANAAASRYEQFNSGHYWFTAPSGTAGNTISFTQAMTLDASGNLGVGTTGPVNKISVLGKISASDSNFTASAYIHASPDSGANRNIGQFSVSGASNGLQINWDHASSKIHVIINNIPTSSAGLPSGTLYSDGGTIKIA